MYKCTLLFTVENEFMLNPTSDRRDKFATMKSMSTESRVSSESSGSQQKQVSFGIRPMGGSYSSGGSAQLIQAYNHTPKLAQVAKALMAAKAAGELPQASNKDLEYAETYRLAQQEKRLQAQQAQNGTAPHLK